MTPLMHPGLLEGAAPAAPTAESLVQALYARWREAEAARIAVNRKHAALRARFVARYGDVPGRDWSAARRWEADPENSELKRLDAEADRLEEEGRAALDAMAALPAETLADVRCKLLAAVDVMAPREKGDIAYQEELALAVMRDAARALGEEVMA